MKKFPFVFVSSAEQSADISRAVKLEQIRKIGPRLYTSNTKDAPEQIVRQNCWQIVSLILPGALVGYRSALENRISPEGRIYVTEDYSRVINLPGLEIVVLKGPAHIPGRDMPFFTLFISCQERAFLENLSATRDRGSESKTLSRLELEERLVSILDSRGPDVLNGLRDRARDIAPRLGMEAESKKLDDIIGAIQGTRETQGLTSPISIARSIGEGYDPKAVERFAVLRATLSSRSFRHRPMPVDDQRVFYSIAFFDAYFSNFIEGTEFEVEEAREIIESGIVPADRSADGHDILGTYKVVGSIEDMTTVPGDFDEFINILTRRHSVILEGRPDKQPGRFKEKPNRAGETRFVEPALVWGTLRQGYELYRNLEEPFARALAMFFIVSDVHPFNDGNGRLARAMMNAELVAKGETRIIIPSVFRGEYLAGVKRMTRESDPTAFIKQHEYTQEFTSKINFSDRDMTIETMRRCNAFAKPEDTLILQMPAG
jgi:hypothetical protein